MNDFGPEATLDTLVRLIRQAAQSWGEYPTPAFLLETLHKDLLRRRYTTSAVLLYGPVSEDRPQGPFDYLEVTASWSRRYGQGAGLSTKIYLRQDMPYRAALEAGETIIVDEDLPAFTAQLDPFVRALIGAEKVHTLALIPLTAGQRKIGLLVVATSQQRLFSDEEIQLCQTISEFIALSTAAQLLEQQRDLIQWGRAALLDAVTNGVVMVLPDAEGARVLTVNKVFSAFFNVTQAEVQGLLLPDMLERMRLPPPLRQDLAQQWLRVPVRDTARQHGEFDITRPDGQRLDVAWYSGPVYQDQRVIGRIYTFQDVTAERTAVDMRATFLNRISHELRTPLTSIQGYAQMIVELGGDDLPPVARDSAKTILESGAQLRAVFDDLITLSRADAGDIQLGLMQIDLPDLAARAVDEIKPKLDAREQRVQMIQPDTLPSVMIDFSQILEVLKQLLDNAARFSPPQSQIRVEICEVTEEAALPVHAPPDLLLPCILTRIVDEGPGISPEDLNQIFVPFFRSDWAQQQKLGGTGLGLLLAQRRVELHRGALWAEPVTAESPGGQLVFSLPVEAP